MTVSEYIEKLKQLPPDLPLCREVGADHAPDEVIYGPELQNGSYTDANGLFVNGEYVVL